jgi:hypothetical protein
MCCTSATRSVALLQQQGSVQSLTRQERVLLLDYPGEGKSRTR